jgi:hypothetical protein
MPATPPGIDLASIDLPRRLRRNTPRGRLLYLDNLEAIVVPHSRLACGWRCHTVTRRDHTLPGEGVDVRDTDLTQLQSLFPADRSHMSTWQARMLWQAWTFQRWPGGQMAHLCRLLAEKMLRPNTLVVDLPADAVSHLTHQVHLRPPALRRLLQRLVGAGALTPLTPSSEEHWGRHGLIIPRLPFTLAPPPWPGPPPRVIFADAKTIGRTPS